MQVSFEEAVGADDQTRFLYFFAMREHALKQAEQDLRETYGDDLRLTLFDKRTSQAIGDQWWSHIEQFWEENPDIDSGRDLSPYLKGVMPVPEELTEDAIRDFSRRAGGYHPEKFEVAVWKGDELCGIAIGRHEEAAENDYVSIRVAEGSPVPNHALKGHILRIVDTAACYHADAMGLDKVAHIGPYSQGAMKKLAEFGLSPEPIMFGEEQQEAYIRHVEDVLGSVDPESRTGFIAQIGKPPEA